MAAAGFALSMEIVLLTVSSLLTLIDDSASIIIEFLQAILDSLDDEVLLFRERNPDVFCVGSEIWVILYPMKSSFLVRRYIIMHTRSFDFPLGPDYRSFTLVSRGFGAVAVLVTLLFVGQRPGSGLCLAPKQWVFLVKFHPGLLRLMAK